MVRGNLFTFDGNHGNGAHQSNLRAVRAWLPLPQLQCNDTSPHSPDPGTGTCITTTTTKTRQSSNNTSQIHDPENPVLHHMTTLIIIMSNGDIRSALDHPSSRLLGCLLSSIHHPSSTLPLQNSGLLPVTLPSLHITMLFPSPTSGPRVLDKTRQDRTRQDYHGLCSRAAAFLEPLCLSTPLCNSSFSPDRPRGRTRDRLSGNTEKHKGPYQGRSETRVAPLSDFLQAQPPVSSFSSPLSVLTFAGSQSGLEHP